jgi:transposase
MIGMSLPDPAAVLLPTTAEQLPDDVATLKRMILELVASLQERDRAHEALRHRLDQLLRRLYGPRGERFDQNQPLLFDEPTAAPDPTAVPEPTAGAPTASTAAPPPRRCRPHGRRRLPANLPRESRHHELPEAARVCLRCGQVRLDIGVDTSEQLEYRPASLVVIEHVVHKYACPCCRQPAGEADGLPASRDPETERMSAQEPEPSPAPPTTAAPPAPFKTKPEHVTPDPELPASEPPSLPPTSPGPRPDSGAVVIAAPKPAQPLAKGLAGPGLLAHLIVSKFVDHLPLYRLERIYERQGVFLPRSTLCDWLGGCGALLRPLYDRLVAVVLQSRALHTDDTPVKMQELPSHLLSTARLWVYLGDAAHPYNVFDFTVNRKRDGPQQFLAHYQGYLHADAFSGYDGLYLPDPGPAGARILEVACNAHARRKFYEARSSAALESHQALAYYRQLYELERRAQELDFSDGQRLQMRQDLAVPILETFHAWLQTQRAQALPKSPLGEAVGYALHNWRALIRYTEAGLLSIDNNVAEREMKRIAIGRKNWLFVGSPQGGRTAAVLFSFTSTCQRLGVEPWAYLQDVLTRLPTTPPEQLGALLPDRWQAARAVPGPSVPAVPGSAPPPASVP